MPYTIRIKQNRVKREVKDIKLSELNEIRKENQKLKRAVSKLKRELEKFEYLNLPKDDFEEPVKTETKEKVIEPDPSGCPGCGNLKLTKVPIRGKTIIGCNICHWRKVE